MSEYWQCQKSDSVGGDVGPYWGYLQDWILIQEEFTLYRQLIKTTYADILQETYKLSLQYFTWHTVSYSVDDALKAYTIHHMHTAILHSAATEDQTMTIERTFQGAYRISAIVNGYLVSKQYMGYTKREAIQAFKEFTKQG